MDKKTLCVFDLDGTLYNKDSPITCEIRNRVVKLISNKQVCDLECAQKIYEQLPITFPNPYHGLASVGISGDEYSEIFNSISVEKHLNRDYKLIALFKELSKVAYIHVLSFAPTEYAKSVLKQLGVYNEVCVVSSVEATANYLKKEHYLKLKQKYDECLSIYVIGDDYKNDLLPAIECGFKTKFVDFKELKTDIHSVVASICSELREYRVPSTIRVEVSSQCNERCIICPYSQREKHGQMDRFLFEKIIIQHSNITQNSKIIFPATIGEPFLNRNFLTYVKIAHKYYSSISTFSNATHLTKEVVQEYIDSGGTELMLTLHGFHKLDFEAITKTNFYEQVKKNIMICAEVNADNKYPLTIYLDIYSRYKNLEYNSYIKKLRQFGVILNILDIRQTHNWGGKIGISSIKRASECSRITTQFGVRFDGTIIPCCADINGEYILGDAKKDSLKSIFNSKEYILMHSLSEANLLSEIPLCSYCNI